LDAILFCRCLVFLVELLLVVLPQVFLFMSLLPPAPTCVALLIVLAGVWLPRLLQPIMRADGKGSSNPLPGQLKASISNMAGPQKRSVNLGCSGTLGLLRISALKSSLIGLRELMS
jgi:hypothetical protein